METDRVYVRSKHNWLQCKDSLTLSNKNKDEIEVIEVDKPRIDRSMIGQRMILAKVCDRNDEHFCGSLHMPIGASWKGGNRECIAHEGKLFWPCGLKSIVLNGRKIVGEDFVVCKCGNERPVRISATEWEVITTCANDTLLVELKEYTDELCVCCDRRIRFFSPRRGIVTKSGKEQSYFNRMLCAECVPVKQMCADMFMAGGVKFDNPSWEGMKKMYRFGFKLENRADLALKEQNHPLVAAMISDVEMFTTQNESFECMIRRANMRGMKIMKVELERVGNLYGMKVYKEYGRDSMFVGNHQIAKNKFHYHYIGDFY